MIVSMHRCNCAQLDESKAYEEMVESLTAKNLELGERCGELEATIADLESSLELSEELDTQQKDEIRDLQVLSSDTIPSGSTVVP